MTQVRRANVVLTIKDDQVERFLDMGYDVLDTTGAVVKESAPRDPNVLRRAYLEHEAEIARLKDELRVANEKIATLTAVEKPKKTTKKVQ